jgi:hypothetical protein
MVGVEPVQLEQNRHFFLSDLGLQLREIFPPFFSFNDNGAVSDGRGGCRFWTGDWIRVEISLWFQ